MKDVILRIKDILGTDIRIRSRVQEISRLMNNEFNYKLDFAGVSFISRSFADELLSMQQHFNRHFEIVNAGNDVDAMLRIVKKGRARTYPKVLHSNSIRRLESMEDVAMFFNA